MCLFPSPWMMTPDRSRKEIHTISTTDGFITGDWFTYLSKSASSWEMTSVGIMANADNWVIEKSLDLRREEEFAQAGVEESDTSLKEENRQFLIIERGKIYIKNSNLFPNSTYTKHHNTPDNGAVLRRGQFVPCGLKKAFLGSAGDHDALSGGHGWTI